jgi:hypothetical protein
LRTSSDHRSHAIAIKEYLDRVDFCYSAASWLSVAVLVADLYDKVGNGVQLGLLSSMGSVTRGVG